MRSSGIDPATVITTYRQQQHLNRAQTRQVPSPFIPSPYSNCNTPPSRRGVCNGYGHTSPDLPPIEGHQKGPLPRLPKGSDNNNYHSLVLPSGLVVCVECEHVTSSFEMADRHQKESHSGQTTHLQTLGAASLMPSGLVACNECGETANTFELIERHQQEAHHRLANEPDYHN